jgi:hypothetical protein
MCQFPISAATNPSDDFRAHLQSTGLDDMKKGTILAPHHHNQYRSHNTSNRKILNLRRALIEMAFRINK